MVKAMHEVGFKPKMWGGAMVGLQATVAAARAAAAASSHHRSPRPPELHRRRESANNNPLKRNGAVTQQPQRRPGGSSGSVCWPSSLESAPRLARARARNHNHSGYFGAMSVLFAIGCWRSLPPTSDPAANSQKEIAGGPTHSSARIRRARAARLRLARVKRRKRG